MRLTFIVTLLKTKCSRNTRARKVNRLQKKKKKTKTVLSPGKMTATAFRDTHGVIFIDYLEKGKIIKNKICISTGKRPYMMKKECFVPPRQRSVTHIVVVMDKFHKLEFE